MALCSFLVIEMIMIQNQIPHLNNKPKKLIILKQPPQPENTSSPSESETAATVRYQNGQFTPQTVTIQSGDVVKFINQGDGDMWVGSDAHPTHTQYAGTTVSEHCQDGDETSRAFDQCSVSDTYTFTLEQTGEWDYHNHVNASAGGTIVVE